MRWILPLFAALAPSLLASADEPIPLTYEQHIRPLFRAHCLDCHGATEELKGGLDLRLVRSMLQGGDSGPTIVAGQPEQSLLIERLRSGEMPPGAAKMPAAEIAVIERWIAAGAPTARPEPESLGPGLGITAEERSFWSFQPIRRPIPPAVPPDARARTPVDAFLFAAMSQEAGPQGMGPERVGFAPDAERRTLIQRAHFDLTGLPPSLEALERWLAEPGDDWLDRLVSELLASPHYGELWGRHWLDIAGYADSEGYTVADAERPWAWKYRDWVVDALNADLPIDQFVTQQLAGDELAGPIQGDLTAEQIELLTATGFLRMAADGTGSGADNPDGRNQVMADTLKIVGTSLLGLSLQCAQCHDHRYDPIPQTDYFSLRAVFEPALDWHAWRSPEARRVSLYTEADRRRAAEVEAEAQGIAAERGAKQAEYMRQALDQELAKFDEPLRTRLRAAYDTPGDKRNEEQQQLLASHPSVNVTPGVLYQYLPQAAEELKKYDQRIAETRAKKPVEEFLRALVEPANHAPETHLFYRGDHQQPKQVIAPGALSVATPEGERREFPLDDPALPTTGRRLAFARWLVGRDDPLFARVIVNRVWMHHFGQGLVATPADFGMLGARPTHPELLDYLADELIRSGWSLKRLHCLLLGSTAWRQRSDTAAGEDDEAALAATAAYARKRLQRLEGELIRDRMLAATGGLDERLGGAPVAIKEDDTGQVVVAGPQSRRSLYVQARRSRPVAMLQSFDAPVMETNCESRPSSTVATQSLILLNGEFVLEQAGRLADRVLREARPLESQRLEAELAGAAPVAPLWQYGQGRYDESTSRTGTFTALPHWTGAAWQGGATLPDAALGWALLHAAGGHPDVPERAVIRRWVAPADGVVSIRGALSHGSENGDGVRGRIVSSRAGLAGEWRIQNGGVDTPVAELEVKTGDTIDFITDCIANQTSDSFQWPVTVALRSGETTREYGSQAAFSGPPEPRELVAGQVDLAWRLALGRSPSGDELRLALGFLDAQRELLRERPALVGPSRTAASQSLTNMCQSLLTCNEFLYVE